jgi:hypothetical protein
MKYPTEKVLAKDLTPEMTILDFNDVEYDVKSVSPAGVTVRVKVSFKAGNGELDTEMSFFADDIVEVLA